MVAQHMDLCEGPEKLTFALKIRPAYGFVSRSGIMYDQSWLSIHMSAYLWTYDRFEDSPIL